MKYEMLKDDSILHFGRTLYRIKRIKDDLLGGYIENETNLSQLGDCFVYDNARVYDTAQVFGDAQVYGNALVSGSAQVFGDALVSGNAWVFGNVGVYDTAQVSGNAQVYDNARVFGNAQVFGDALVYGNALVFGNAQVFGDARVIGDALVYDNAQVYDNARVFGDARVIGDAQVFGNIVLRNYDEINKTNQYFNIIGFEFNITVTHSSINIGCRSYTIDQLDTVFDDDEYGNKEDIPRIKLMVEIALDRILEEFK